MEFSSWFSFSYFLLGASNTEIIVYLFTPKWKAKESCEIHLEIQPSQFLALPSHKPRRKSTVNLEHVSANLTVNTFLCSNTKTNSRVWFRQSNFRLPSKRNLSSKEMASRLVQRIAGQPGARLNSHLYLMQRSASSSVRIIQLQVERVLRPLSTLYNLRYDKSKTRPGINDIAIGESIDRCGCDFLKENIEKEFPGKVNRLDSVKCSWIAVHSRAG